MGFVHTKQLSLSMNIPRLFVLACGVLTWSCVVQAEIEEKTVAIFVGTISIWDDAYRSKHSEEFRRLEGRLRKAFLIDSSNAQLREAAVRFQLLEFIERDNRTLMRCAFTFKSKVLKRVYPFLVYTSSQCLFGHWITRFANYDRRDFYAFLAPSSVYHPDPIEFRIIGCSGIMVRYNEYIEWDPDLSDGRTLQSLRMLLMIRQSIENLLIRNFLTVALSHIEVFQCYERPLSRTYCKIGIFFYQDRLFHIDLETTNPSTIKRFEEILKSVPSNEVEFGFREMELEDLRSPLDMNETVLRVGAVYTEHGYMVNWNSAYRNGNSRKYIEAVERIHRTIYLASTLPSLDGIPYEIGPISFIERTPQVFMQFKLKFDTAVVEERFSMGLKDQKSKLFQLLNEGLDLVWNGALFYAWPSY